MDILALFLAMVAGAFGAAIGGLFAFVIVGILVMVGVGLAVAGGGDVWMGAVPFGIFGPHVAGFASGVAGAAWLARSGKMESGRDIASPLMGFNSPGALLVGALFGGIGYLLLWFWGLIGIGAWTDGVALTVIVSAIIVRLVFGKTGLFGKRPNGQSQFGRPPAGTEWLPWQVDTLQILAIGMGGSVMGGALAIGVGNATGLGLATPGAAVLGFGISAFSLILLFINFKVPVTHHITLLGGLATVLSGSIFWGLFFGIVSAFIGEYFSRAFQIYGDTHIDPPAGAIFITTTLVLISNSLGLFTSLGEIGGVVASLVVIGLAIALGARGGKPVEASTRA
jgi:hypothetical protein